MGNIFIPIQHSKVSKLKGIIRLLTSQQRKIRSARTNEYTRLKRLYRQMQTLTQKYSRDAKTCSSNDLIHDDIRQVRRVRAACPPARDLCCAVCTAEMRVLRACATDLRTDRARGQIAEEIIQRRQKIHDLRECGSKLTSIQAKIQTMLNANFTHRTIQTVNCEIERANIDFSIIPDAQQGTRKHLQRMQAACPRQHTDALPPGYGHTFTQGSAPLPKNWKRRTS